MGQNKQLQMNNMTTCSSIIPAASATECQPFALTLDQRRFSKALLVAKQRLLELTQAVEIELGRLLHDVEFSIDMNLCQGTGLDSWLAEPGRLLLQCPVLVPNDDYCFFALDFTGVHHLADLALGGQLSKVVQLENFRRAKRRVSFDKRELRELMGVYSRRVASGEWRDYAIDHEAGMAVFSIFRSAYELPLYRVAKIAGRSATEQEEWMVISGSRSLKRTTSLVDALSVFDKKLEVVR